MSDSLTVFDTDWMCLNSKDTHKSCGSRVQSSESGQIAVNDQFD